MTKFLDGVYKYSTWLVLGFSLLAYMAYQMLKFNGDIEVMLGDWRTWMHLGFVCFLNVTMVGAAYDGGTNYGISSREFELADELNNKLIKDFNNNKDEFRKYVKDLNDHELKQMQDDFLFAHGDKTLEELNEKELKQYKKLKAVQHNIYGFNLPLYYEVTKNSVIQYSASIKKNQGKTWKQINRVLNGILFGSMTLNVFLEWGNFMDAITNLLVIASGLAITYVLTFVPQVFKFKFELPKKVIQKKTLYDGFIEYKNTLK